MARRRLCFGWLSCLGQQLFFASAAVARKERDRSTVNAYRRPLISRRRALRARAASNQGLKIAELAYVKPLASTTRRGFCEGIALGLSYLRDAVTRASLRTYPRAATSHLSTPPQRRAATSTPHRTAALAAPHRSLDAPRHYHVQEGRGLPLKEGTPRHQ